MCVIIVFQPGQMLSKEKLKNACHNNWHSYGLVTKVDGKLDIKRVLPESGEVDHEMVWKDLEDNRDYERILHLRHTTAGLTDLANCQPFDVYFSKTRQIVFMHNGTLYDWKSKIIDPNDPTKMIDDDSGPSDTRNYVENFLQPAVAGWDGGAGKGDLTNSVFKQILYNSWPGFTSTNRGIVISNDQDSVMLGGWKRISDDLDLGDKLLVSNDDYFQEVIRGPEHARRLESRRLADEARRAKEAEERKARSSSPVNFSQGEPELARLRDFQFDPKHGFYGLKNSTATVLQNWDFYSRDSAVSLGYATLDELRDLQENQVECILVMDWIFTDYAKLYEEHNLLDEKHTKASKLIGELKGQIADLQGQLAELREELKDSGGYKEAA